MNKYLSNTYLDVSAATITNIVHMDDSIAVYCDDTIFYPQSGGQPCDLGYMTIDGLDHMVDYVEITELGVAHLMKANSMNKEWLGEKCIQNINMGRRIFNAKSHTAGHLISHIFEKMNNNLSPIKGHHHPDSSYIELIESERSNDSFSLELISLEIQKLTKENSRAVQSIELNLSEVQSLRPLLSKFIPQTTKIRMVAIDGFLPVPCGGTHVSNTSELSNLKITRIRRKKDRIKVSYSIN
ncbi:alanyl-tRNA editing protein [Psychromonas sp. SP041]|uniref:alanyl-tRNA editing protein n=1 Tax=Psychromonas sp. SP041 TaxID=1365007 RepID=UPI0010C7823C|nr:alanyl-tRNA editing protein [Psychromonas sp. SP041]